MHSHTQTFSAHTQTEREMGEGGGINIMTTIEMVTQHLVGQIHTQWNWLWFSHFIFFKLMDFSEWIYGGISQPTFPYL